MEPSFPRDRANSFPSQPRSSGKRPVMTSGITIANSQSITPVILKVSGSKRTLRIARSE